MPDALAGYPNIALLRTDNTIVPLNQSYFTAFRDEIKNP